MNDLKPPPESQFDGAFPEGDETAEDRFWRLIKEQNNNPDFWKEPRE